MSSSILNIWPQASHHHTFNDWSTLTNTGAKTKMMLYKITIIHLNRHNEVQTLFERPQRTPATEKGAINVMVLEATIIGSTTPQASLSLLNQTATTSVHKQKHKTPYSGFQSWLQYTHLISSHDWFIIDSSMNEAHPNTISIPTFLSTQPSFFICFYFKRLSRSTMMV